MALGTVHSGIDVPHVREVHVIRDLIDTDPRNGLTGRVEVTNLLDFPALSRRRANDYLVATEAGPDGRNSSIHRTFSRKMAVHTGDLILARVNIMREGDGLLTRSNRSDLCCRYRFGGLVLSLYEGQRSKSRQRCGTAHEPSLGHTR